MKAGWVGRHCLEDEVHAHMPLVARGLRWVWRWVLGQCSKGEILEERSVSCHNPLLSRAFVGPNYSRNLHDLNCFPVFSSFANSHRCRIPSATAIPVSSNAISADAVGILPLYIALCLFIIPM